MKKKVFMMMVVLFILAGLMAQKKNKLNTHDTVTSPPLEDVVFTSLQIPAEFPGGVNGWHKYLERNLNTELGSKYIKIPKGEKSAYARIIVYFKIDKNGNVTDLKADSVSVATVHKKLIEEAIRVFKQSPRWIPASQDGRNVIYTAQQSITFVANKE